MTTSYPAALDAFDNPDGADTQQSLSHIAQHANVNDAVEAIEATLGTNPGIYSDYSPTLTQSGAVAKTTTRARYTTIGDHVHVGLHLAVTGAGTANNTITISLPETTAGAAGTQVGTILFYDASAGATGTYYLGAAILTDTTHVTAAISGAAGGDNIGKNPNVALANGDFIVASLVYEKA